MLDSATLTLLTTKFLIGSLIFIRITGFLTAAPFFKSEAIPATVKIMLSLILAMGITSAYWDQQPTIDFHLWYLVLLAAKEFMVGAAIGFAANGVFYAANLAGGLIDTDMGFQTSMLFDRDNANPSLVGTLKELITLMIFLGINGHHFLIESIYISMKAIPLTTFVITGTTVDLLVKFSTSVLILGMKMAAPMLIAMFLTNLALSLLARVAPQTNIFMLSFQVKISVGLVVLAVSVPLFFMVTKYALEAMETETMRILLSMYPGRV